MQRRPPPWRRCAIGCSGQIDQKRGAVPAGVGRIDGPGQVDNNAQAIGMRPAANGGYHRAVRQRPDPWRLRRHARKIDHQPRRIGQREAAIRNLRADLETHPQQRTLLL